MRLENTSHALPLTHYIDAIHVCYGPPATPRPSVCFILLTTSALLPHTHLSHPRQLRDGVDGVPQEIPGQSAEQLDSLVNVAGSHLGCQGLMLLGQVQWSSFVELFARYY